MESEKSLREHLAWLLQQGNAHVTFPQAVDHLPVEDRGRRPPEIPHSPWRLLEHLRICQWDILEFSRNPNHVSPEFPDGYWPLSDGPPDATAWDRSIAAFQEELRQMVRLVTDPSTELHAPIPHGTGQTVLREALLLADHNAYHIGQLVLVRRALGCWADN